MAQLLQHLDGCHSVVIDGFALYSCHCAGPNDEIFNFVSTEEFRLHAGHIAPGLGHSHFEHPFQVCITHSLRTLVGGTQKCTIAVQGLNLRPALGPQPRLRRRIPYLPQMGIPVDRDHPFRFIVTGDSGLS